MKQKVSERTFYPPIMDMIREMGGSGVAETQFNSEPDIDFHLNGYRWLMSVKIGQSPATLLSGMLQYLRHKEESGIPFAVLLMLPDEMRQVPPTDAAVSAALRSMPVTAVIDAGPAKDEVKNVSCLQVLRIIKEEILARLEMRQLSYYSLQLVTAVLRQQVEEIMKGLTLDNATIVRIITNPRLLMGLGALEQRQAGEVADFLAAYILLSQVLFLRLFAAARPGFLHQPLFPVTINTLRGAFKEINDINYRQVYSIDVLDVVQEGFVRDVVELMWGLEIERVRYELPGRIFHELMPADIRKKLAAFYTRPVAANLLSSLCIDRHDQTVLDPACGSGTILVAAYQRKLELFQRTRMQGNPHKRFCESELFGADIMPFAVHLASANLAAIDPSTTIDRTQIIQGDSLAQLQPSGTYTSGVKLTLFHTTKVMAETTDGEKYEVKLDPVDVVMMNPPFTKVERGLRNLSGIDVDKFRARCGGEVGLWGHFIPLADALLKGGGLLGGVLPINVLRGRESKFIRKILFEEWTPLVILKPTMNYGFSERSEYRDILLIARKEQPSTRRHVKFCLVKKDLTRLTEAEVYEIARNVEENRTLRSPVLDVDSHPWPEVRERFDNMMWFCSGVDFVKRDLLVRFLDRFSGALDRIPHGYFRTGLRTDEGVSSFLFLTRRLQASRTENAFLAFDDEDLDHVVASTAAGTSYTIERTSLFPSLRTIVGMSRLDVTDDLDYVAHSPYSELEHVCRAAGFHKPKFLWGPFWARVRSELRSKEATLAICRRINPFSPATCLNSVYSSRPMYPSDQLNIARENDMSRAKAVCVLASSVVFFVHFFLLKEESTGRYVDVRLSDLEQMALSPKQPYVDALAKTFDEFSGRRFPCLSHQFDARFDDRYEEFWSTNVGRPPLWTLRGKLVDPEPTRIAFDLAVCRALGVPVSPDDLRDIYEAFVDEMILTRGLARD